MATTSGGIVYISSTLNKVENALAFFKGATVYFLCFTLRTNLGKVGGGGGGTKPSLHPPEFPF